MKVDNTYSPTFADYDTTNLCDVKFQKGKNFAISNA